MLKKFFHWTLVYFGLRNCCDNQNIVANHDTMYYYEYECKNCGNIKSGSRISQF